MSLFASLAGLPIMRAKVTIPWTGIPHADVTVSTDYETASQLTGPQTLILGTLTLACSTYRVIDEVGRIGIRLVGGAGGWQKTIPAISYGQTTVTTVLTDAAGLVGEALGVIPSTALTSYVRALRPAAAVIQDLLGDGWWLDMLGLLQSGTRPDPVISSNFQAIKIQGAPGRYEIGSDSIGDWVPGATFANDVVSGTVGRVMHTVDQQKVRTEVLVSP